MEERIKIEGNVGHLAALHLKGKDIVISIGREYVNFTPEQARELGEWLINQSK